MTSRLNLYVSAIAVALGGCTEYVWVKPGGSMAEFERDRYACERDARMASAPFYTKTDLGGMDGFSNSVTGWNVYLRMSEQCMSAQGYVKRPLKD